MNADELANPALPALLAIKQAVMTARDVKFSFDRMLKDGVPYVKTRFKHLRSVEVKDPYTVELHLSEVTAAFLSYLADEFVVGAAVVSEKALTRDNIDFRRQMVGTGPFQLMEFVTGDHITLKRFAKYWAPDQRGFLDQIVLKLIPEMSSQLAAMRANQVQLMFPDPPTAQVLARDKRLVLEKIVSDLHDGIGINTLRKPFDDVRVRRGIMLGLDRKEILEGSLLGEGEPSGPLPPPHPGAVPVKDLPYYQKDVSKAKQLLADAGLAPGFTFALMVPTNFPDNVRQGELVQQQLQAIGVRANLEKREWGDFLKRLNSADYDAAVIPYASYPDVELFLSPRPGRSGPTPPAMVELFEKGAREVDPLKRLEIYRQIVRLQAEEGFPMIWLVAKNLYAAMQPEVKGFTMSASWSFRGLWTTWLSK